MGTIHTQPELSPAEHGSGPSKRIDSVDFLRGIAMMGLVLVHSVLYFTPLNDDIDQIHAFFGYALGDVGAALFTTVVGVSFVLSLRSRAGLPQGAIVLSAVVRGLFLLAVAMFVSIVTTGLQTIFEWDVLALIAIASILLAFLRPLPDWALLALSVAIVAVAPVVRGAIDYLQWWGGRLNAIEGLQPPGILVHPPIDYAPGMDLGVAVVGLLVSAWFPVLPWMMFPVAGMVLGRQLVRGSARLGWWWAGLGTCSLLSGLGVAYFSSLAGDSDPVSQHVSVLSFTPESTTLLLVQLGLVLLVMAITHAVLDRGGPAGAWMDPIRLVSRYALTVYVLSYFVIFAVIHVADLVRPNVEHQYALTGSLPALLFGVAFVVVLVPILRMWDRHGGRWSLEWMMSHLRLRAGGRTSKGSAGGR